MAKVPPTIAVSRRLLAGSALIASMLVLSYCTQNKAKDPAPQPEAPRTEYGGFDSPVSWGEHLVTVSACHDCHSPKKMTALGPEVDTALLLSGHPAKAPGPDINRKEAESKGLVVTDGSLTAWAGPWGVSYTANLTSDSTGIGGWNEGQFLYAIRNGKYKGMENGRPLLPPMPWQMYRHMTDDELKAIFAYLKSTRPVRNIVPPPLPPAAAPR
ncbi:diheme cytochrome c-553 [Paraflavisolibacter sp. H34]|uniref:c-type cytochrome n=1 Tax=Huijunlia imazamoxiresistens TaxID=3127457 RepID=UPI0030161D66